MHDEMTTTDLVATAHQTAHPNDNPSAEHAPLIDELAARLTRLSAWRERMTEALNPHLREVDGSDLTPDHIRVSNMLERISSANEAKAAEPPNPDKSVGKDLPSPQQSAPEVAEALNLTAYYAALRGIEESGGEETNAAEELRQKLAGARLERDELKEDLEFRRGLFTLQEEQLAQARIERDEARRELGEAREVLGKAARFVEAFEPKSGSAEADQRETLERLNSFLNPNKKVSPGNGVPETKNDPSISTEGNTPSGRFPRGLARQHKGAGPTPPEGRGRGMAI